MREKQSAWAAWVAWALCVLVIAGALIGFPLLLQGRYADADFFDFLNGLLNAVYAIAFGVVGALILSRRARNRTGWLLMVIGLAVAWGSLTEVYIPQNATSLTMAQMLAIWFNEWGWWLLIGPLLLILLTFPTGHLLSPRWRWVAGMVGLLFVLFLAFATLSPTWHDVNSGNTFPNPLGLGVIPAELTFEMIQVPWIIALLGTVVLCMLAVLVRYRRSGRVEREQLKWFLYACAIFIIVYAIGALTTIGQDPPSWSSVVFDLTLLFLPVSIGIAILRYRLFDIDIIIRRTVTYALVGALLAVVYFGSVILLQQLFASVTGERSEVITVLSTLAIAALFVPARNRIQTEIDRRFNRKKYDAQKVLNEFAGTVRDETDLEKLSARLMQVVDETMQPKSVSMWLKQGDTRGGAAGGKTE